MIHCVENFLRTSGSLTRDFQKNKSRYSSNSEHLTFILIFNREMLHRFSRCQCQKGNCPIPSKDKQTWDFRRSSHHVTGPMIEFYYSDGGKMEISYLEGT